MGRELALGGACAGIFLAALNWSGALNGTAPATVAPAPAQATAQAPQSLLFEPDAGRTHGRFDFVARGHGYAIGLTPSGQTLDLGKTRVRTVLAGARASSAQPAQPAGTRINSYTGPRSAWRTGLRTFERVRYRGVYPGIDVVYRGQAGTLEYDFELQPGADPKRIALAFPDTRSLRIARDGSLVLGKLIQKPPVAYQQVGRERTFVDASYVLEGSRVRLHLGRYNHGEPLVIDPVVTYADYIGGTGTDFAGRVAADSAGNAYVAGSTNSPSFPGAPNGGSGGGYVMKITPSRAREWITYLAGDTTDIVVDGSGNLAVTGKTSGGLAVTPGAAQSTYGGNIDGYVGKLAPDGTRKWLTYLGGANSDEADGVDVDGAGNVYTSGRSISSGMATAGTYDTTADTTWGDGLVTVYGPTGTKLRATYIGGSQSENATSIGVQPGCQSNCAIFIGGGTGSGDFPKVNAADGTMTGSSDAFAAAFNSALTSLTWSTYYGDSTGYTSSGGFLYQYDGANAIVVSAAGNPTIAGYTDKPSGRRQAFARTYYGPTGTYVDEHIIGGADDEIAYDVARDAQDNLYVVGGTSSTDFPTTAPSQPQQGGSGDAFAVKFNRSDAPIFSPDVVWSTYLGGGNYDYATGVTADGTGGAFIVGATASIDFPVVNGTQDSSNPYDGFFTHLALKPVAITGPEGTLRSHSAGFTYVMSEPTSTYRCRLAPKESAFTACPNSGITYTDLPDGDYSFDVTGIDAGGTPGPVFSRKFTVETKPVAQLSIAPNPALAGRAVTFDGSKTTTADQAIAKFEWDLDGDGNFDLDTGTTPTTSQTYPSPGTFKIAMRVTDGAGASSVATGELRVTAAGSSGLFGVTINNGAQYTRTPDVVVTANFPAGTTGLLFSNDGGFLKPSPFTPQKQTNWKLDSSGPERLPKIVYVRFQTGSIISETFTDDIILDETPPKMEQAAVVPSDTAAGSVVRAARVKTWKLKLKASDSNSGVARVQVTANKRKPGKLLAYKRKLTVKSAKRPKFARARDRAGNYSRWRKIR